MMCFHRIVLCVLIAGLFSESSGIGSFRYYQLDGKVCFADQGDYIKMVCKSSFGHDRPRFIYRNHMGVNVSTALRGVVSHSLNYTIKSTGCSDSDIYECRDDNGNSRRLELYVKCPLEATDKHKHYTMSGRPGSTATTVLEVKGYPRPSIALERCLSKLGFCRSMGTSQYTYKFLNTPMPLYLHSIQLVVYSFPEQDIVDFYKVTLDNGYGTSFYTISTSQTSTQDGEDKRKDKDINLWPILAAVVTFFAIMAIVSICCLTKRYKRIQNLNRQTRRENLSNPSLPLATICSSQIRNQANVSETIEQSFVRPPHQRLPTDVWSSLPTYEAAVAALGPPPPYPGKDSY